MATTEFDTLESNFQFSYSSTYPVLRRVTGPASQLSRTYTTARILVKMKGYVT